MSHQSAMLFGPGRTKRDLKESRKIMGKMGIDVKRIQTTMGTFEPDEFILHQENAFATDFFGM